jgi:4-hydroxyphenylpyruvate dioxygenase
VAVLEIPDPYGSVRSRALVNADRSLRITLNVSQGRSTMMARSLSSMSGAGVHHIAFSCTDIFDTIARLEAAGVQFLSIPDNYYHDVVARFGVDADMLEKLRAGGILYDRSESGEFFHIFTEMFAGRFFFEIVQRVGDYDAHGELNAPVRRAAQARHYALSATP